MSQVLKPGRVGYVDALRGLAVVGMFFVHTQAAWVQPALRSGSYGELFTTFSGMVAPVFLFLAGLSLAVLVSRRRVQGRGRDGLRARVALRGLQILALGYGLHLAYWALSGFYAPWVKVLKVDILHCIGLSFIIIPSIAWPAGRFNRPALVLALGLILAGQLAAVLRLEELVGSGLASYLTVRASGALFPCVPYAAWVAMGLVVGSRYQALVPGSGLGFGRDPAERRFWFGLLIAIGGLCLAGLGIEWAYYRLGIHQLVGEPTRGLVHMFCYKGAATLAIFAAVRLIAPVFDKPLCRPFTLAGQNSLLAYALHLFFVYHIGGKWLLRTLTPAAHLFAACLFTGAMLALVFALCRWSPAQLLHTLKEKTLTAQ